MTNDNIHRQMRGAYREAERRGIVSPVFATLQSDSPHARKLFAAVHGAPMPGGRRRSRYDLGVVEAWEMSEAVRWLRTHCGIGGAAVANLLEATHPRPDHWALLICRGDLGIAGFDRAGVVLQSCTYYDEIPCSLPDAFAVREDGLTLIPLENVGPGSSVTVCGRDVDEAVTAASLARAVHRRALPPAGDGEGQTDLPVDDALLALILLRLYGDQPRPVAETVRALRKTRNREDRWLLTVLRANPELRPLANQVDDELTGPPASR